MREQLAEDQSDCFLHFNSGDNLMEFHFKSNTSTENDVVLVWDITNNTFIIDDNKYFSCKCKKDGITYAGSAFGQTIYKDNDGGDDDGDDIIWSFTTQNL